MAIVLTVIFGSTTIFFSALYFRDRWLRVMLEEQNGDLVEEIEQWKRTFEKVIGEKLH